jgi:hypothetical protein
MNQLRTFAQRIIEASGNGDLGKVENVIDDIREYLRLHPDNDSAERFYEQGEWAATTLGGYVKTLIDNAAGVSQDVIIFRVAAETMHNAAGNFARLFEVVLVPQDQALEHMQQAKVTQVHHDLQEQIKAGLIK